MGTLDVYLDIPKSRLIRNLNYIKRLVKLWLFLLKEKPDLIHSFDLESGIYIKIIQNYLFTARQAKLIIGYGANKIEHVPTAAFLSRRGFQPDAYTCNSMAGRTSLLQTIPHPAPAVHVIYNGLNVMAPQTEVPDWRKNYSCIVGCISKFDSNKKGERIFELAEYVGKLNPDIHFVFIGTGGNFNEWQTYYETQRHRFPNLTLLGVVQDAMKLVHYFDLGILFSEHEGFPNAILEYMLCGKPVIATQAGETAVMIQNGETGVLMDRFDTKSFGEAILRMAQQPDVGRVLGLNAQKRAISEFSFQSLTGRLQKLYSSLLKTA